MIRKRMDGTCCGTARKREPSLCEFVPYVFFTTCKLTIGQASALPQAAFGSRSQVVSLYAEVVSVTHTQSQEVTNLIGEFIQVAEFSVTRHGSQSVASTLSVS